jgi:two-component system, chemotaxis family, sensor kinase CheA
VLSRRRSVLLVEDDERVRRMMTRHLETAGYEVVPAATADDAFTAFRRSPVDVIIADVRLGEGRSGLEVLEFANLADNSSREVLGIVFTGAALSPREEDIVRRHRSYVFFKPHEYGELVEFLNEKLGPASSFPAD